MERIEELLDGVRTMGIGGHIRPDGDCIGSCMGLYLYIKENYPQIQVDVYLDHPKPCFGHIRCLDQVKVEAKDEKVYDLFVTCDVSARDRLAIAGDYFDNARQSLCVDHHISNPGFAKINYIRGKVSSACEVLYGLLDPDKVSRCVAASIYTGMAHDTGVFQYSSTSPDTMRLAAKLMETGIDFSKIIDQSFFQKTYIQNQVMGRVLTESILLLDGKCVIGYLKKRDMDFYGVDGSDLDGIVSQLRLTKGVEVAMFLYEIKSQVFKVSLRSNGKVDVSRIAVYFGGGGHMRAAGCDMSGSMYDVINNVSEQIEKQLLGQEK